jgi:hypothetical protein
MQSKHLCSGYETYASLIAPAAAGCALGILFGRGMRRGSSNVIALTLLAASAAIAAPVITDLVQRTANRPGSERGSRRRLEGIRSHGMPDPETSEFFSVDVPGDARPARADRRLASSLAPVRAFGASLVSEKWRRGRDSNPRLPYDNV